MLTSDPEYKWLIGSIREQMVRDDAISKLRSVSDAAKAALTDREPYPFEARKPGRV